MKVEISDISSTRKEMNIVVPKEEVNSATEEIYRDISKGVNIKGFRKGKAPRHVIKMYYADYIQSELAKKLLSDKFDQAVRENDLVVVSLPEIKNDPPKENEDFSFSVKFDIKPEVLPQKYTGFELKKQKIQVNEENIEDVLKKLQETYATVEDIEDPEYEVSKGDYAIVDVTSDDNQRLNREKMTIEAGVRSVYPGLEDAVIGLKVKQDKVADIKFPENHFLEDMRGKDAQVKLIVSAIKHKKLAELNDEFAKQVRQDVNTLDEFKIIIKDDLIKQLNADSRMNLEKQVRDNLIKDNPFDIPVSLIQFQASMMIRGISERLTARGMRLQDIYPDKEALREETLASAENIVRISLLIEAIAKKEGIQVSDEDINQEIVALAERYNVTPDSVRKGIEERQGMEEISFGVLEKKVFDYILNNSSVEEVEKIEEENQ